MSGATIVAIGVQLAVATGQGGTRSVGPVPAALRSPSRVLWIAAEQAQPIPSCILASPREWACDDVAPGARGLIVIVGDGALAYVPARIPGARPGVVSRGRAVVINPAGVAPDDLHDLQVTAWRPERSRLRPHSLRFAAI